MPPRALPLLLLAACQVESNLAGKPDDPAPFDSGDGWTPDTGDTDTDPPPVEECNGVDDDGDGLVDEDFPDSDLDGLADCMEQTCPPLDLGAAGTVPVPEECSGTGTPTITDPWNVGIEWQYRSGGSGAIVMPAVGNLTDDNGDGVVDEDDVPDIAFTTWTSNTLVALHGDGSGEIFEVSGFNGQGGVTIADVDGDGAPEVVAFSTANRIAAVDAAGRTEWSSAVFGVQAYPQPTVCDADGDGDVEVIGDVGVVDGATGATVGTLSGISNSWRTPLCADLDRDGVQEIVLGNRVFHADGSLQWTNAGTGSGNFAAVADVDGDPGGEVFFVSGSTMYLHDDDGAELWRVTIPGSNPGPPSVADFDGDGEVEIAIPANTQISVWNIDGTRLWTMPINDTSGLAGCSGYDVNGDGAYEVLYADQDSLDIYDGATGTVLYTNPTHSSGTVWEYPVIADVDNDGSAEIVVASNGGTWQGVTVFGHDGDGWPKSGTTWGTHDFMMTNLNPDGSVPSPPDSPWETHNVCRARPWVDDPSFPDLGVSITDVCVMDCTYGPVALGLQVWNAGGTDVEAGASLAVYAVDATAERLVATVSLPAIASGEKPAGFELALDPADVGERGFRVVVDDDGTGVGAVDECEEGDNEDQFLDAFCP